MGCRLTMILPTDHRENPGQISLRVNVFWYIVSGKSRGSQPYCTAVNTQVADGEPSFLFIPLH